jgi:hypothetical protein
MKLINLLVIVLLLPSGFGRLSSRSEARADTITAVATVTAGASVIVVVTNATDSANGDTTNIDTLIANPGSDGISFREAIRAANNTLGVKRIEFASNLKGATILLGSAEITDEPINLLSGQLTINGDIDGDGAPDVTVDGSLGATTALGSGLSIWSDYNTIENLKLVGFYCSVQITPLEPEPVKKTITGNQIKGNVISSPILGEFGITLGSGGHVGEANAYKQTGLLTQETLITGNTISVKGGGIFFAVGSGGAHNNQVVNTTISNNHLIGGSGIGAGAGDTASDYGGVPGPI